MRRRRKLAALVEGLEFRRLLATITVTSTADTITPNDGAVTLREAITAINAGNDLGDPNITAQNPTATNAFGTKDTIDFNIAGSGVQKISTTDYLPNINKPVTIDGYSQPSASANTLAVGDNATILIQIDGTNAAQNYHDGSPPAVIGLTLYTGSGGSVVRGLCITNFGGDGILVDDTTGSTVTGNFLGILPDGKTAAGNFQGVDANAAGSVIGGTAAADRNIISGNYSGVGIAGDSIQVQGNYIGTNTAGTAALANTYDGINLEYGENDTIGGTTAAARNVIAGNGADGIDFAGNLGGSYSGTTVQGNYIGVAADGKTALANGSDGVEIAATSRISAAETDVTIGGTAAGAGNVISGNTLNGVEISQDHATGNVIEGNYIGTDFTGLVAVANAKNGIQIHYGASLNTIGGTTAGARNIISGNSGNGVEIDGISADIDGFNNNAVSNTVQGNYIGVDATGSAALGNDGAGVVIDGGTQDNTVGGTSASARNVISGNGAFGVAIDGTGTDSMGADTTGNVVEGNYIGSDATGKNALGDGNAGVYIDLGAEDNTIGGTDPGAPNLISGIGGAGVIISGYHIDYSGGTGQPTVTNSNTVQGNYIGTDVTGTKQINNPPAGPYSYEPFNGDGIYIDTGAYNNTIGGLTAAARNIIAGNLSNGVYLSDYATANTVEGNYVGVDVTGSKAIGNGYTGIEIASNSNGDIIGGMAAGAGNVISANGAAGVEIYGSNKNVVQGNHIGTDATGSIALGNKGAGVYIEANSSDNAIGGISAAAGNVIANNGGAGVSINQLSGSGGDNGWMSVGNTIRFNSIYANTGLGSDLENDGVTVNDPQDGDIGGNDRQNYPVLVTASSTGSSVTVAGTLNSLPSTNFTLDFFANDTIDIHGNSQGKQYLGSVGVITDAGGNAKFSHTFNVAIGSNKYITAAATNESTSPYGDTSEFSQAVEAAVNTTPTNPTSPTPPTLSISDVSKNEGNSGTTSFTFTITRSGDLSSGSSVKFATADGTATVADNDYQAQSNTIGFNPNQASKTITILVNGDTKFESDETFTVNLSNATGATIANAQATGTIINDDASPPPPPASGTVTVVIDPIDSTKTSLDIVGTPNADTITVTKSGASQGKATVKINGVNKGTFSFTGIILVYGNAGNDNISIDSGITRSAWIWGGDGADSINGGGGTDMIFGQGGNDSINGNAGRDILIGGDGTDKLSGGGGDDVLIAGDFKSTPTMSQLASIQKEWTRTDKAYVYRVNHLTTGGGYNTIKLNSSTLFSSTTLKDSLTGGADSDLFFVATSSDKITDKASSETVVTT